MIFAAKRIRIYRRKSKPPRTRLCMNIVFLITPSSCVYILYFLYVVTFYKLLRISRLQIQGPLDSLHSMKCAVHRGQQHLWTCTSFCLCSGTFMRALDNILLRVNSLCITWDLLSLFYYKTSLVVTFDKLLCTRVCVGYIVHVCDSHPESDVRWKINLVYVCCCNSTTLFLAVYLYNL